MLVRSSRLPAIMPGFRARRHGEFGEAVERHDIVARQPAALADPARAAVRRIEDQGWTGMA